jgi:hypothetical protein
MNKQLVGGMALMLIGSVLFGGEKSLGIHNPVYGVMVIGAGIMFAMYSFFSDKADDDDGPRRRVTDNSV